MRRSIQVFDASGTAAVHKIHATGATDIATFDALVESLAAPAAPVPSFRPVELPTPDRPDDATPVDWKNHPFELRNGLSKTDANPDRIA